MSRNMKPKEQLEDMKKAHIVKDFYLGEKGKSPHILIADNYCAKTPEEVDDIMRGIARIAMAAYECDPVARNKALHPGKQGISR